VNEQIAGAKRRVTERNSPREAGRVLFEPRMCCSADAPTPSG
jgi:hypothetical protein